MIKIEDLSFTYPGAKKPTLSHVNLEITKGEFVAVIGNNGCGKSTLCKILNGLIPHFIPASNEPSGHVYMSIWRLPRGSNTPPLGALQI